MRVHSLFRYPVKSCAGLEEDILTLDAIGPVADRRWMIVREDGTFLTQRQHPQMTQLRPEFRGEECWLRIGEESLVLGTPVDGNKRTVRVWRSTLEATDLGEQAATLCSDFLGEKVRMVWMDDACVRRMNPERAPQDRRVSFADGYPLLLTTVDSLAALNASLETVVSMSRFRPNLVLEGVEAWQEHRWKRIQVGDVEFSLVKPCTRCTIVTIDQQTGQKNSNQPLRQLTQDERFERQAVFGENALHSAPGVLRVGDEVKILEWKEPG